MHLREFVSLLKRFGDPMKGVRTIVKKCYHKGIAPFKQPHLKSEKICIRDKFGEFTYKEINDQSNKVARALSKSQSFNSNVAFLTSNNHQYSVSQFGIWKSGLACVPLCKSHPPETLKYYIEDSKVSVHRNPLKSPIQEKVMTL